LPRGFDRRAALSRMAASRARMERLAPDIASVARLLADGGLKL
jgi:hypothetical protein